MKRLVIFLCSPRPNGVADRLASIFGHAAADGGAQVSHVPLRDYKIIPCQGCMACMEAPWQCRLRSLDQTEDLFRILLDAEMAVFASPIFFYALPAHFKAFVDRSQRFWSRFQAEKTMPRKSIPALAIMAAGRRHGAKLFEGSLLTLRWFGKFLNLSFDAPLLYKGLDQPENLAANAQIAEDVATHARNWVSGNMNLS